LAEVAKDHPDHEGFVIVGKFLLSSCGTFCQGCHQTLKTFSARRRLRERADHDKNSENDQLYVGEEEA
jgi:hypothetical protein